MPVNERVDGGDCIDILVKPPLPETAGCEPLCAALHAAPGSAGREQRDAWWDSGALTVHVCSINDEPVYRKTVANSPTGKATPIADGL